MPHAYNRQSFLAATGCRMPLLEVYAKLVVAELALKDHMSQWQGGHDVPGMLASLAATAPAAPAPGTATSIATAPAATAPAAPAPAATAPGATAPGAARSGTAGPGTAVPGGCGLNSLSVQLANRLGQLACTDKAGAASWVSAWNYPVLRYLRHESDFGPGTATDASLQQLLQVVDDIIAQLHAQGVAI